MGRVSFPLWSEWACLDCRVRVPPWARLGHTSARLSPHRPLGMLPWGRGGLLVTKLMGRAIGESLKQCGGRDAKAWLWARGQKRGASARPCGVSGSRTVAGGGGSDKKEFRSTHPQSSSICRAAIHYGVLDDRGGLVDVTRNGRKPFFVKSQRHGVDSLRWVRPGPGLSLGSRGASGAPSGADP